eukprot:scaffold3329_cov120-Isochrysis_galbana.AAC.5
MALPYCFLYSWSWEYRELRVRPCMRVRVSKVVFTPSRRLAAPPLYRDRYFDGRERAPSICEL